MNKAKLNSITVSFGLIILVSLSGCSGGLAPAAGGAAGGFAASETLRGIEKDLESRETALVERWKAAVESGAKQEALDAIQGKIQQTRYGQAGAQVVRQAAGTDWTNPKAAGVVIAQLGTLAYALLTKRKLNHTEAGINKFMAKSEPLKAKELYDSIAGKKAG